MKRRLEILDPLHGIWVFRESMLSLREGDIFRLFNPDGTIVRDEGGRCIWVASSRGSLSFNDQANADVESVEIM